ncbi:CHAT domain-domain-containing protein [Clohesyomyces aquaticus]|uniref:CHAT domain-domain-containing protein n=1 Tax=Clohesyomyces aquaticus TaxID=1231657 RepID=A0A1Y1ZPC1_9PLEO|nr:CHAT domain-domain-containing protein [Clohesyomyces aquaticus]
MKADELSSLFVRRYEETSVIEDLDLAIDINERILALLERDDSRRMGLESNLASKLGRRFEKSHQREDISRAIQLLSKVLAKPNPKSPSWAPRVSNLSELFRQRFLETGDMDDFNHAFELAEDACKSTPTLTPVPAHYPVLNTFAIRLCERYERTGSGKDLDLSISILDKLVSAVREHRFRSNWLRNLNVCLRKRYDITLSKTDITRGVKVCNMALTELSAGHVDKALALSGLGLWVQAGRMCFDLCAANKDWSHAFTVAKQAIQLLPKLTSRSLELADKQQLLGNKHVAWFASDAAAVALQASQDPYTALELLEIGRGVLASSIEELRTDVHELRDRHPDLAQNFTRLQEQLSRSRDFEIRQYDTSKQLDNLLEEIRAKAGFERFLLAPSPSEMRQAAKDGPIVTINVSEHRCDAFLIRKYGDVEVVPLPDLNYRDTEEYSRSETILTQASTLVWLWKTIARPVLDALGYTRTIEAAGSQPRVWWVATGLLSKFPIHAAGLHLSRPFHSVIDRALSSYTSSIKALLEARQRKVQPRIRPIAVLIAMKDTPGSSWGPLDFATDEINMVRKLCPGLCLQVVEPLRHKPEVLIHLGDPAMNIFHFAGHGFTDSKNPSNSKLILDDWEADGLTVGSLLDLNIRKHSPFLAYLSACGTGQVKDAKFLDESIHIISACQLAGFRHVVGTLWEVNDKVCLEMARTFYNTIRDAGMTDESVCVGLHQAMHKQRKSWLDRVSRDRNARSKRKGSDQGSSEDEEKETSPLWIPYVHFGI